MHNKLLKKWTLYIFLLVLFLIFFSLAVSAAWYKGSTHQHTGFSTWNGYYDIDDGSSDECEFPLEGLLVFSPANDGRNVSYLKQNALDQDLSWLAFTDHSYCLDEDEFNVVKTDCSNAQQAGTFVCLNGEELSVSENVLDKEIITSVPPSLCRTLLGIFGEAHIQAVGINSYIAQTPFGVHCPLAPKAQKAIRDIKSKNGLAIIAHPDSVIGVEFLDFEGINKVKDEDGIEIWNGEWGGATRDQDALELWIHDRLLKGVKVDFQELKSGFLVVFGRKFGVIGGVKFGEGSGKSSEKILALIKENKSIPAREMAEMIGISQRAVEKQLAILRKAGRIKRVGGAKGGYWEALP